MVGSRVGIVRCCGDLGVGVVGSRGGEGQGSGGDLGVGTR